MRILYIPLDERPCNYYFPELMCEIQNEIELVTIDKKLLPDKKKRSDINKIWDFVLDKISSVDYAVLSIDTLLYGGLLASRLHHDTKEEVDERLNNLKKLKEINPNVVVYAFNTIMRCPHYNSGEEEPSYYEEYGEAIFNYAYLNDKKSRLGLTPIEEEKLKSIDIPKELLEDYVNRRNFNLQYNIKIAELVKNGIIDNLVIPQDDSSEFGYTAISQKAVVDYVRDNNLETKVHIYPGADEVGSSLIARAYNTFKNRVLKIYPVFSSTLGPTIIPLYEDRPILESLKYHTRIINAKLVQSANEADIILAYNTCGKIMQEAFNQDMQDLSYTSHRNLLDFVLNIRDYILDGRKVALVDSAFSNGSDLTLLKFLDEYDLLDKLIGYAGWNTNCNSLGTVLCMASLAIDASKEEIVKNLAYRYIEDGLYQALVRKETIENFLPSEGLSYYDFKTKQHLVEEHIKSKLQERFDTYKFNQKYHVKIKKVYMPWYRMFEIGMLIEV